MRVCLSVLIKLNFNAASNKTLRFIEEKKIQQTSSLSYDSVSVNKKLLSVRKKAFFTSKAVS